MAAPAILKLEIIADAKKALAALGQTESKSKGMSNAAKVALTGAATAITAFGVTSVKEFTAAQESQKALADAFERFPKLAGTSQAELQKLNTELQKKTKYDDDALASGQAVIAQFGVTGDQLKRLTPLLADYASRTGKDIPSAAQDVGKAMLGNAKALKNIGIKYTATGDQAADFENIMGLLNKQVGGFAEKEGTTAAGQAAILENQFGELQEQVGGALVPVLMELAPILTKVAGFLADNIGWILPLVGYIGTLVAALKAWNFIQATLNITMEANPVGAIILGVTALIAVVILVVKHWDSIKRAIMATFDWVKRNWPLLLAILTGPFGLAVLAIVRNWETIKRVVSGVLDAIRDAVTTAVRWIVDRFQGLTDFVRGIPGKIADALSGIFRLVTDPFRRAFDAIAGFWNRTVGKLAFEVPGWVPGIGGKGFDVPDIPRLASGGTVMRSGLAVVHAGEQFSGVGRTWGGGSTVINVRITAAGLGADAPEIQRAVVQALRNHVSRNGPLDVPVRSA